MSDSIAIGIIVVGALCFLGIFIETEAAGERAVLRNCQLYGKAKVGDKMIICPEIQPAK